MYNSAEMAARIDLVHVDRTIDGTHPSRGFLVGASSQLVLLHTLTDRVDLDGYEVLRATDVAGISNDFENRDFLLRALRLKGIAPTPQPGVKLDDVQGSILSAQALFPLLVIDRELVDPQVSEVGRVVVASGDRIQMRLISPTAEWVSGVASYLIEDVTRVGFGGDYENTLAMVANHATD